VAQGKAALDQAEAARSQSQRRLDLLGMKNDQFGQKIIVAAPLSGKVLEINVATGEYRNDTNAPLMTIADLSTVWVSSDVPETQIRFINPGERLDIMLSAYPGETFRARVTRIADVVDPQTRTVKVRAEMDNSRGLLRPEMFCTIRHVESTRRLPVVPAGAVVHSEGQNVVYREKAPGDFEPVRVELGNQVDGRVAIVKGLSPGDRIVVDGVMLLKSA
jgi:cobalt-zinc-cadmium efflux system membrane fusion protein